VRARLVEPGADPVALVDPEHRPDDDLERQPGAELERPKRLAVAQPGEGLAGRVGHDLGVGPHALAVKGRRQQLALALVLLAGDGQQRSLAQEGVHGIGREHAEQLGITVGEQLLDQLGLGGQHHAAVGHRREEGIAVAIAQRGHGLERFGGDAVGGQQGRPRSRRQGPHGPESPRAAEAEAGARRGRPRSRG